MSKIDDGGPAFPIPMAVADGVGSVQLDPQEAKRQIRQGLGGMSLRAYFAGQAVRGFGVDITAAWIDTAVDLGQGVRAFPKQEEERTGPECIAQVAVMVADALIAELNKEPEPKTT